ncbi:MAG: DUF2334 domain-containing protein [Acidimicrobiia bacterium]|nr:DUF2334 domain-containing protein [Acidimicrobiia bacterium]
MSWFVVSIHDVAPATLAESSRWSRDLQERGVPATLLVVPGPWRSPAFEPGDELATWLHERVAGGDEVAQHGWMHRAWPGGAWWRQVTGQVAARGCAELWSIERDVARRTLGAGLHLLRRAGFEPVGMTPPGYLASPTCLAVLRELEFRYSTSHLRVLDLRTGRRLHAPAMSHRPGGLGEAAGREMVGRVVRARAERNLPVRIALHPEDLHRPGLRQATLRAIDDALEAGLRPTTYERLVA